ncbi:MAG: ABC transporter substrate-binding protein [Microbacterium sp.]|uniref:ABC transporter substrate-binding protein n=1 Tax=Microbacterium sp. TaxID=51671 RepID=UPI003D6F1646
MKRLNKVAFPCAFIVMAMVLALGLAACGGDDDSSSATGGEIPAEPESGEITMGTQPWIGYGPWHVADQEGFFADQGVDVNLTNFTTDNDLNSAFASGKMDVSNVATHTALKLIEAGLDAKIVLLEDVSTAADAILAGPDIGSIEDLEGQRVAYEEGTTSDILLRYALQQNGMSIDDVEKVPLPAADAGSAAIAGRVPAAVTYEPYLTTALSEDPQFELLYTAGENPGLISDVLIVSGDALEERPGQILALMRAWQQAIEFYNSDTGPAQSVVADAVGADVGELKTAFEGVEFFDLQQNVDELTGSFAEETVPNVVEVGVDAEILGGEPDIDSIIDPRFVEEAAGE